MYHRFGWAVTHRRGCQRGRVDRSKRWMIFDEMFDGERKKRKKSFGIYIVNPHNLSGRCPNSSDIIRYDFASQFSWMKLCSLCFLFSLFFEEIEMNCKIWSLKLSLSQRRRITYSTKLTSITFLDKVELETKSVRNKKLKRYRQSRDKSYLCLWVLVQLYSEADITYEMLTLTDNFVIRFIRNIVFFFAEFYFRAADNILNRSA